MLWIFVKFFWSMDDVSCGLFGRLNMKDMSGNCNHADKTIY